MNRFTFSREPRETGLARVTQGERGYVLKLNGKRVASVDIKYKGWTRDKEGYFFYGRIGEHFINTASKPVATVEQAKADCLAWFKGKVT